MDKQNSLYTIGHSNRAMEEFIALLKQYQIKYLLDEQGRLKYQQKVMDELRIGIPGDNLFGQSV